MEYKIEVRRKFRHMRIYKVSKRINDNSNAISRAMQSFVDRYITKRQKEER